MRAEIAKTKPVRRFLFAVEELQNRPAGMEGMGVLYGKSGEGKTTTVAFVRASTKAVVVTARRSWNEREMLRALAYELGADDEGTTAHLLRGITSELKRKPRPVFVDEADYLLPERLNISKWKSQGRKLDTLRDIYNETRAPVILIGEERVGQMLAAHDRFRRRVTQWVRFDGIDLEDVRTVALACCEVEVADDLLERIHRSAEGRIAYVVICLSQVEAFARVNCLERVDRAEWGENGFDFGLPEFPRGRTG